MKQLATVADNNGVPIGAAPCSDYVLARVVSTAAETVAIPEGARFVSFSSTGNFYMRPNADPVVPSADITDGTAGELNPGLRYIEELADIRLIAPAEVVITMSFYK